MKKIFFIIFICSMLIIPSIFAMSSKEIVKQKIDLIQKNLSNNKVIDNGIKGVITLSYSKDNAQIIIGGKKYLSPRYYPRIKASARGLNPETKYALVYYEYEKFNNLSNYVNCISSDKTDDQGSFSFEFQEFNWLRFIDDGKNQKFWIVRSSDIDCKSNKFQKWNPDDYLFETKVI